MGQKNCTIQTSKGRGVRNVGCVYKSPGSSGTNNEQLNELISEVMRYKHSHLLLLGDRLAKLVHTLREY